MRTLVNGRHRLVVRFVNVVHASPVFCGEQFAFCKRIGALRVCDVGVILCSGFFVLFQLVSVIAASACYAVIAHFTPMS